MIALYLSCRVTIRYHPFQIVYRLLFRSNRFYNLIWKPPWILKSTGSSFLYNRHYNRLVTSPICHLHNLPSSVTQLIHLYLWVWVHFYNSQSSSFGNFMSNSHQPFHRTKQSIMNNNHNVFSVPVDLCYEATRASQVSLLIRPSNPRMQNLCTLTRFFPRLWGLDNVVLGRVVDY